MNSKTIQGLEVPEIGLGTFKLIGKPGEEAIKKALSIGYRHLDTAQDYNNLKMIGQAVKQSRVDRDDLFITTKIDRLHLEPARLLTSAEQSLLDLQLDYVDLLLIHWPNPGIEIRRTLEAMFNLKEQAKVVEIGVCNFPMTLLSEVVDDLNAPIFCNQVEYHPFLGQFELLDYAADKDLLVTAYSPLGRGLVQENELLADIGNKYGKTASQIALRWLIEQEQVVAIPKATSSEHLEENLNIYDFELEDEDFYAIDDLDKTIRIVNPSYAPNWT